jgi:hypothetical protein
MPGNFSGRGNQRFPSGFLGGFPPGGGRAMSAVAVGQCVQCGAVVNVHWAACLVCRTILPSVPGAGAPPQHTPDNYRRMEEPVAPILPGWVLAYRDRQGVLRGGCDDRAHGTVQECRWDSTGWTVYLTDGQQVSLSLIQAVGKTDNTGRLIAAWTVKEHGYDGNGRPR